MIFGAGSSQCDKVEDFLFWGVITSKGVTRGPGLGGGARVHTLAHAQGWVFKLVTKEIEIVSIVASSKTAVRRWRVICEPGGKKLKQTKLGYGKRNPRFNNGSKYQHSHYNDWHRGDERDLNDDYSADSYAKTDVVGRAASYSVATRESHCLLGLAHPDGHGPASRANMVLVAVGTATVGGRRGPAKSCKWRYQYYYRDNGRNRGQSVDLAELLPACLGAPDPTLLELFSGTQKKQTISKKGITTIEEWVVSFNAYIAVVAKKHPNRVVQVGIPYAQLQRRLSSWLQLTTVMKDLETSVETLITVMYSYMYTLTSTLGMIVSLPSCSWCTCFLRHDVKLTVTELFTSPRYVQSTCMWHVHAYGCIAYTAAFSLMWESDFALIKDMCKSQATV